MRRIPVVLVTGFLGSGKTTLLRRLATDNPERRLVFLINEFASLDVDGETMAETGVPTHSVVGGSLFCECKAGDFIRTMKETVHQLNQSQAIDTVFIETSGMADPTAIGTLMRDHGLEDLFLLTGIVTVVAPARLAQLLQNLPVAAEQIRVSNLLVLNKIDTVDDAALAWSRCALRELNPSAVLIETTQCQLPFRCIDETNIGADLPDRPLSTCDANPFSTATVQWPERLSVEHLRDWLLKLPAEVLRVKGRVQTPTGWILVEKTVDGCHLQSTTPGNPGLVLIVHDDHESILEEIANALLPIPQ